MKLKTLIILCVLVAVLWILKVLFFPSITDQSKAGPQGKPSPSAVSVYVIKSEKLENTLNASGTIVANEDVVLKPEVAGKIISLPLKEGTTVQKNDLLVKINDADYQAQLRKLQLQLDLATTKLNRNEELLKINGISKEEYDNSENTVKSIKADIDYTEAEIAKTEIRAPFNGMLGLKSVSEGAYVSIGTSVATVVQTDPVKIDFTVSEKHSPFMKKGVKVLFTIDGIKNDMTGEIYAIEPKIDASLRTLTVRAVCPNKDGSIYPGAFANVRVLLKDIEDAVMIPTEAVIPELRGKKVFIVKNGKSSPVMIETGIRTSTKVQVLKGLQMGDTVITTGIMGLKPDAPVRIMPAK